jgi:uncharacterized protein GlcG (DUF336 family)
MELRRVLILRDDVVVGAVRASGDVVDLPDTDEACAVAGAQHAGSTTEVLEPFLGRQ